MIGESLRVCSSRWACDQGRWAKFPAKTLVYAELRELADALGTAHPSKETSKLPSLPPSGVPCPRTAR